MGTIWGSAGGIYGGVARSDREGYREGFLGALGEIWKKNGVDLHGLSLDSEILGMTSSTGLQAWI